MLQRLVEEKKKREFERAARIDEAFAKAHALAIENNESHAHLPPYIPLCLTRRCGTRVPAPTVKGQEPAVSAPTAPESSASTASTSADNASEKNHQISDSSSTVDSNQDEK
ncbi:hypothetical protein OnM2_033086 [Erysiphe neolycopersici]|uniref:Uncharacterized protein n=1 Tax=Erysiphe neolycopersici TaxID=212602 RepID=A0A420HYE6_9PEZI|nr:hypothetical protein OnM2_033086 [Erysiphe neolycopersici]